MDKSSLLIVMTVSLLTFSSGLVVYKNGKSASDPSTIWGSLLIGSGLLLMLATIAAYFTPLPK